MGNASLSKLADCKQPEETLRKANDDGEQRVRERTAELEKVNAELKAEVARHKRTEKALQESVEHLRNILNSLPSFIGLLTPEGRLAEVNQRALNSASLSPETEGGRPFEETYWWSYSPAVQVQLRTAIQQAAQGRVVRYDVPMRVGENQFLVADFTLTPVRNSEGQVTHVVPSAVDITERKDVKQFKSDVLDMLSHELRTPLHIITGYVQLLLEGSFGLLTPEQAGVLQRVQRSGRDLLELVTGVLDMQCLDAGLVSVEVNEVQVAELLAGSLSVNSEVGRGSTFQVWIPRTVIKK